jgi:hypothetical protein
MRQTRLRFLAVEPTLSQERLRFQEPSRRWLSRMLGPIPDSKRFRRAGHFHCLRRCR